MRSSAARCYDQEIAQDATVSCTRRPALYLASSRRTDGRAVTFYQPAALHTCANDISYEYGKLGETTQETKTVSSHTQGNSANSPEVYTTQYSFDTFGRLMTLTLPDAEILTHRYGSGGNVEHIEGARRGQVTGTSPTVYLTSLLYDKFEQRTDLTLGNGIHTHYSYNADNRRRSHLDSSGSVAGNFFNPSDVDGNAIPQFAQTSRASAKM